MIGRQTFNFLLVKTVPRVAPQPLATTAAGSRPCLAYRHIAAPRHAHSVGGCCGAPGWHHHFSIFACRGLSATTVYAL